MTIRRIDEIVVGERHRRDLGDLTGLAANMQELGLLQDAQPKTQGARGIGKKVASRTSYATPIVTYRKDSTLSEAVAIKRALEPIEREAAKERQREGQHKGGKTAGRGRKASGQVAHKQKNRAADKAAKATNMARRTLEKSLNKLPARVRGCRKMLAIVVNYSGPAWASAKVTDSIPTFGQAVVRAGPSRPISAGPQFLSPVSGLVQPPPKPGFIFRIAAAGREKPWTATRPQAFWRTYGELLAGADDPNCGEREAALVRRFGPVNEPETESDELVVYTGGDAQWFFQEIARAWDPEDADGFSRVSLDRRRRDAARIWLSRHVLPAAVTDIEVTFGLELRPQLQARSLYAFMALSAASMLQRQASMRRCQYQLCQLWFEPPRADALYCSNTCRGAHHGPHPHPTRRQGWEPPR